MSGYQWQDVYIAAMLENDRSKMEERIQAAETALNERKREFDLNQDGTTEENKAIEAALRGLSRLRVDGASWLERQQPRTQAQRRHVPVLSASQATVRIVRDRTSVTGKQKRWWWIAFWTALATAAALMWPWDWAAW